MSEYVPAAPVLDLSPEARYPVAIEQNYAVARWIVSDGAGKGLDAARLAVAGDSVGGNMTAALTLMAKERGDVPLVQQVLFYPVTDASFDTLIQDWGPCCGVRRAGRR